MDDRKSRSEDFRDLRWDRESRHWREPWAKERNSNERILLWIQISIHFLDYLILATLWTTIGHRLMQDHRIWDRISIIRNPLARSRVLGRWTPSVSMKVDFLVSFQSTMRTAKPQQAE